jgi:hypothetical protein
MRNILFHILWINDITFKFKCSKSLLKSWDELFIVLMLSKQQADSLLFYGWERPSFWDIGSVFGLDFW